MIQYYTRRFRKSIVLRFLLVVVGVLIVAALLIGTVAIAYDYQRELADLESEAIVRADFLGSVSPEAVLFNDFLRLESLMQQTSKEPDTVYGLIVTNEGRALTRYVNRDDPLIAPVLNKGDMQNLLDIVASIRLDESVREVRRPIISEGLLLGEIWLGYSTARAKQRLVNFALITSLSILVISIGLSLLSIFLFNWQIGRPLQEVTNLAQAFAAGDLRQRAPVQSEDEIGRLQMSFNIMSEQLQETLTGLQEAKQAAENANLELRRSEAEARKLSQVASRTDNLVIISDAAGNVEWVNNAFTRVTGYSLAEVVGQRPGKMLQGPQTDPDAVTFMREHIHRGEGFNCEVLNYAKDGHPYWVEIEVQPVRDDQGRLTNFIAIETDVTQRRQDERQLREAKEAAEQAARAKAAFLASMSHEIRTPLNAVIGLNNLLLNTELTDKQRQFGETARNSGKLLMMLVNNVLDFSALESGRVELERRAFDLRVSLQEIIELLRHEAESKKLSLSHEIDASVPPVLIGDETRLRQVLLNLIGNSIKFTEVGTISVLLSARVSGETSTLQFRVRDTGIGIPDELLDRLFQPFTQVDSSTTRKYGGTGLGLAISKLIVKMMDGDIVLDSAVGQGTTFTFTVKVAIGDPASLNAQPVKLSVSQEMGQKWPMRILIVEDDIVNQQVAMHMLEQLGYHADIASNGLEALEALNLQPYKVVFMDIQMPKMDGVTATKRIHETWLEGKAPYIIAMTASALEGDRERFLAAGMNDYISKPMHMEAIISSLSKLIEDEVVQSEAVSFPLPKAEKDLNSADRPIDQALFRERVGEGQDALLLQLVDLFIVDAEKLVPELERAFSSGSSSRVRQLAHRLKGSSANVGAVSFSTLAHKLEKQARQEDLGDSSHLVSSMSEELTRIIAWQQEAK